MNKSPGTEPKASVTRFDAQPRPARGGVILAVATAAYILAFILLHPTWGLGVAALAAVPIMAAGWRLGLRAGLLAGGLVFVLDALLFQMVGRLTWAVVFQSLPGHFALLLIGAGVGRLSDLTAHLRQQITARRAAESALQQAKAELALRVSERTAELKAVNERLQDELAERQRAEAAVKASEQRFRALIQNSADAITLFDATGQVVYDSPAAPGMLGYAPDELVGQNFFEYIHPDDAPRVGSMFSQLLQAPRTRVGGEFRFRHKDGSWRWLEGVSTNLLDDPNVGAVVANYRDVTQRKAIETGLRESEERYRTLFEQSVEAIYLYNPESQRIQEANVAFLDLLGYTADEARTLTLYDFVAHDRESIDTRQEQISASGSASLGERVWQRKDGRHVFVSVSARQTQQGDQDIIVVVARDVTERKQVEDEIRRHSTRAEALARTAARLNAQLDLDSVLNAVCEETARALNAPATAVRLYQPQQDSLYYAQAYGLPPDYRQYTRPSPRALYDDLIRQHGPLLVAPDVQALSPVPNAELYTALNIRTVVTAAMLREGQLIGGLNVFSVGETRHFSEDELALLKSLADQAAQAIVNARLYEENVRKLDTLVALYATAQQLTQSRDLHELARETVRTCVDAFGARLAWLGRAEPDGRVTVLETYGQGIEGPLRLSPRWDDTPEAHGAAGTALRTGFPVVIADLAGDPRAAPWREVALAAGFRGLVALPLISRDRPFGVLVLFSDQPDAFPGERVDFLKSYANQVAAALENARLFAEAQRRLSRTQALRNIDIAITGSLDLHMTLNILLEQVTTQLDVDAADVLLLNARSQMLDYAAGRGFRTSAIRETRRRLGEGYVGRVALERRTLHIASLPEAGPSFGRTSLLGTENFIAYYGVPLIAKGQVKGVLEIFHRAPLDPDPEWLAFLEALAGQAAIAIDSVTLFDDLQRSNTELSLAYETTLEGWSAALDLRDKETEGHTQRVTELTLKLARAMDFSEDELVQVRRGALLHDIGKMGIPDPILLKPGPLTDAEWEIMRKHPGYAYELLHPIAYLRPALDIPYCHHEKWDGTGYPRGLKGEQIPLAARLFAVVDVWDALRSDRPYRPGWSEEKVREHIRSLAGTHFDPQVVEAFLNS